VTIDEQLKLVEYTLRAAAARRSAPALRAALDDGRGAADAPLT
jgi:hypothetical protein